MINTGHDKSDHRPLLLDTEGEEEIVFRRTNGTKAFEARWLQENNVHDVVKEAWDRTLVDSDFASRTAMVHKELHQWDRTVLKEPRNKLKDLNKELEDIKAGPMSDESYDRQREVLRLIEETMEKEEIYWVQRSRANW